MDDKLFIWLVRRPASNRAAAVERSALHGDRARRATHLNVARHNRGNDRADGRTNNRTERRSSHRRACQTISNTPTRLFSIPFLPGAVVTTCVVSTTLVVNVSV